jgi:pyruvate kinase
MAFVWGVHAKIVPDVSSVDEMVDAAKAMSVEEGFAKAGDKIAITAGMPFGKPGTTNLLRVASV